jgi:hypothetical protein
MIQPVDRSTGERVLFTPPTDATVGDGSWGRTAAGDMLAFTTGEMSGDLWIWSSAEGKAKPFVATRFFEGNPQFSPDARWVAYTSNQSGPREVWVQPFPGMGKPVQVSVGGGRTPTWGPLGREIFYLNEGALMAASVTASGSSFATAAPRKLLDVTAFLSEFRGRNYDVHPKTGRFLMIKTVGGPTPPAQLVVVIDWLEGLLAKVT